MKVTLIHQYFKHPSEGGAIRSYYLSQGLLEKGHEVEVITAHNKKELKIARVDGVKVYYLPIFYDNTLGKYQRIIAFVKFVFQSILLLHRLPRSNRLYVISTPLTVGIIALWSHYILRTRYIFEIGDLWPEAPIQLGYIKNRLLKRILYGFENLIYRKAYKIVAMSPDIERIINRGQQVLMIPNMADCEFFYPKEKPKKLLDQLGISTEFVVAYLGTAGRANHLDYLLKVAQELHKTKLPAAIVVAAAGSELEWLKAEVFKSKLSNVLFVPYTDKIGVQELLAASDAVYISFMKVPILASGSPNKFFDGLAAGKVIITNFGGWVKNEIDHAHCGFSYNPEQPSEFISMLNPYLVDKKLTATTQKNARKLAEEKYSRSLLVAEWLTLFE